MILLKSRGSNQERLRDLIGPCSGTYGMGYKAVQPLLECSSRTHSGASPGFEALSLHLPGDRRGEEPPEKRQQLAGAQPLHGWLDLRSPKTTYIPDCHICREKARGGFVGFMIPSPS